MTNFTNNSPVSGDDIDMDRIIVDPDYRRRIITRLSQNRLQRETAPCSMPVGRVGGGSGTADSID